jgi:hypothetical protein
MGGAKDLPDITVRNRDAGLALDIDHFDHFVFSCSLEQFTRGDFTTRKRLPDDDLLDSQVVGKCHMRS